MSTLISSAVGGSKAKPKAPPRRRAAPVAAPAEVATQETPSHEQSVVGSAQEETQTAPAADSDAQATLAPPSPPVVVERPVNHSSERVVGQEHGVVPPGDNAQETANREIERNEALHVQSIQNDTVSSETGTQNAQVAGVSRTDDSSTTSRKRTRDTDELISKAPAKRTKQSSVRSSAKVQAEQTSSNDAPTGSGDTQATLDTAVAEPASAPTSKSRSTRTRRASQRSVDAEQDGQSAPARAPRKPRAKKPTQTQENADITQAEGLPGNADERTPVGAVVKTRKRARKPKSAATEVNDNGPPASSEQVDGVEHEIHKSEDEDPEEHKIDPKTLSMYDLSHDSKFGKISEREKKMAQIDWVAVKQKRIEEAEAIARGDTRKGKESEEVIQSTEGADDEANGDDAAVDEDEPRPQAITRASGGGVRFRLVNGTIVEDADSLTIDRAARVAEAAAQDADVAVEEENDLTRRLNRSTWINARKRDETERVPLWRSRTTAWNEEETDRFYDALRMFGTDFFVISQLFEGRTRRMIKLKFVREERLEPERINAALLGQRTSKIDLNSYAQAIGKDEEFFNKYDSLEHANEAIRESFKDKEEAMRAAVKEDEENNRQREHQRQQREKQRIEAERKKEERARKKAARHRGDVWGAGTLAAADDDGMDGDD